MRADDGVLGALSGWPLNRLGHPVSKDPLRPACPQLLLWLVVPAGFRCTSAAVDIVGDSIPGVKLYFWVMDMVPVNVYIYICSQPLSVR